MRGWIVVLIVAFMRLMARADAPQTQALAPATQPASPGGATLVSVDVHDELISTVLDQISRDSGMLVRFELQNSNQAMPSITLSAQAKPFWDVIENICLQCNCICSVTEDGQVLIHAGFGGSLPISTVAGPLQISVQEVTHLHDLTALDPEYCVVLLSAQCEPRIRVLFYQNTIFPSAATDENGLSLVPAAGTGLDDPRATQNKWNMPDHVTVCNTPFGNPIQWKVRISAPPNAGRQVASLQGSLRMWVADGFEELTADHLEQTVGKPRTIKLASGLEIEVEQQKLRGDEIAISLGMVRHDLPVNEWNLLERRLRSTQLTVVDSNGRRSQISHNGESWGPNQHSIDFRTRLPAPVQIVAQIPIQREVAIPFALGGLPLP